MPAQPPKLLDQVRMALRDRHYAAHAEEACVAWITRFILFHHKRHPTELAAPEVLTFLASLTNAAERNAARSAILFLYRQAPNFPLDLPADAPLPPSSQQGRAEERAALLDQAREALRVKHYAYSTEQSYLDWIKRFIRYHNQRHPRELGGAEVAAFLTYLAVDQHVAASTQNQALAALFFLYRDVLHLELDYPISSVRARESQHLPAVLTKDETRRVIAQLSGIYQLQARLFYGSGLRLLECLRLRVKDVDFERRAIIVRDTKGDEDRVTTSRRPCPTASSSRSRSTCCASSACTKRIWPRAAAPCICPTRWSGSSPTPAGNGSGTLRVSFPPTSSPWTRAPV